MPNLNQAFQWWKNTCLGPGIAYSQEHRNEGTWYHEGMALKCYDCSSFVWYGLWYSGFNPPPHNPLYPWDTDGEENGLIACGFTKYNIGQILPLPGDIVLRPKSYNPSRGGHTEVVLEQGSDNTHAVTMGAHMHYHGNIDRDVSMNNFETYLPGEYPYIYRLGAGGAVGYGSSPYVIAALCGNAWQESQINSGLHQVGGTAFGLFQWDGSRKLNLQRWLREHNYSQDDPEGQILFMIEENDWIASPEAHANNIDSLQDFLQSSLTDAELLTRIFCDSWERPGIPALASRYRYARLAGEYINSHATDVNITEWKISSQYISQEDSLNNAVMLYRAFSLGGGGQGFPGGFPPWLSKTLPVWMMTKKFYIV